MTNRTSNHNIEEIVESVDDPLNTANPFAPVEPVQSGRSTIVMGINLEASPFPDRLTLSHIEGMSDPRLLAIMQELADEARHSGVTMLSWNTTDPKEFEGLTQLLNLTDVLPSFDGISFAVLSDPENHQIQSATGSSLSVWTADTLKIQVGEAKPINTGSITKGLDEVESSIPDEMGADDE